MWGVIMIMRDIANGKVILTMQDVGLDNTYVTYVHEITDDGWRELARSYRVGLENAQQRHQVALEQQKPSEPHACARCGVEGYLASYSRVFEEWLCPVCQRFKLEACQ